MTPTDALPGQISPHEAFFNEKPNWSSMKTFGCDALIRVPTNKKRKGKNKSKLATYLGHRDGLKGWVFETYATKKIVTSRDVDFYEGDWLVTGVKTLNHLRKNNQLAIQTNNRFFSYK